MRPSPDDTPKHEDPAHWHRKAVELRRRAMATTDGTLAARLYSDADACALVATGLAQLPSDAPAESTWRHIRSAFAAPAAVGSLLLLAWMAHVVALPGSAIELTTTLEPNATSRTDDQGAQHQVASEADAGTSAAAVWVRDEIASAPSLSSPESVGHDGSMASARRDMNAVATSRALAKVPDEPVQRTPPPSADGAGDVAPDVRSQHRAEGRLASARSRETERASSAIVRGRIETTASQPEAECRAYVADHPSQRGRRVYGLACRLPNGRWKIRAGPPEWVNAPPDRS
jgi:hypothetical protein